MYNEYFGLTDRPFSIAPDPRYLYMSEQHKEALAHLMYGVNQEGGFILLTGEVGTGKTTVCRCFLKQLDDSIDVAYIVNPKQTSLELLETMCDDLGIPRVQDDRSIKSLTDVITHRLLTNHAKGKSTVLLIDEAQNLSVEVLEQLRLLTNLETDQKKLLQIILLGQPELLDILAKPELRQLSQRVTARFHMGQLDRKDIIPYVQHRLAVAGCRMALFPLSTSKIIEKASGGVPRLINLICDRALLGVYSSNGSTVTTQTLKQAAKEVLGEQRESAKSNAAYSGWIWGVGSFVLVIQFCLVLTWLFYPSVFSDEGSVKTVVVPSVVEPVIKAETVVPAMPDLDELFNASAYTALAKSWGINGISGSKQQLCDDLSKTLLTCKSRNITWDRLVRINRPSVATLYYQGRTRLLFIERLVHEDNAIRLVVLNEDGQSLSIEQSVFEQLWTGQLDFLWLAPSQNMPLLKPGDAHDYIHQVRELLTGSNGRMLYDEALSGLVRQFQTDMGVTSDGVIGPETIMLLNEVSGQAPVLQSPKPSSLVHAQPASSVESEPADKPYENIESSDILDSELKVIGAQG
ncbi:ExeA family protein [Litoribrevibacter albus]|uniref:ATPase AAA n=1 Tax=Litoribrevibacter albus TaxID=1473156 RepID=A0AA37W7N9_9GAMM|nr:AAA family ATPase [Litoribrevibacter albus]GLQ31603.1 ATPase AAA [Litoribrevibacter albus]